jgi:hypothetical protein
MKKERLFSFCCHAYGILCPAISYCAYEEDGGHVSDDLPWRRYDLKVFLQSYLLAPIANVIRIGAMDIRRRWSAETL